jgi:hypothetical protein
MATSVRGRSGWVTARRWWPRAALTVGCLRSQGTEAILWATETGSGRIRAYPAVPRD